MRSILLAIISTCLLFAASKDADAVNFDPLFRVTSINGECSIMPKGGSDFIQIESGKAYPYGSHLKTGRKSSLIIVLSDGNECQVLANADLVMTHDATNPKLKIIKLNAGTVDVDLDPEFENSGYGLQVETAAAICGAIGCKFSNDVRADNDMTVSTFAVGEGRVRIIGEDFEVKEMDADDFISVAASFDGEFTRIKNLKGSFLIDVKNSAGEVQSVEIKLNSIVKIWAQTAEAGQKRTVTIIFTSPDGKVEQAFTYTEQNESTQEEETEREISRDLQRKLDKTDQGGTVVTTTSTTTTSSTTTSTLPNATATGKQ